MNSARVHFLLLMLSVLLLVGNLFSQEPTVPSQPDSTTIDNTEEDKQAVRYVLDSKK